MWCSRIPNIVEAAWELRWNCFSGDSSSNLHLLSSWEIKTEIFPNHCFETGTVPLRGENIHGGKVTYRNSLIVTITPKAWETFIKISRSTLEMLSSSKIKEKNIQHTGKELHTCMQTEELCSFFFFRPCKNDKYLEKTWNLNLIWIL